MITLRPYQLEAVQAVERGLAEGISRPVVSLATGLGKTVTFAEIIRRRGGRALVLAHRDELVHQAAETLERVTGRPVGVVQGPEDKWTAPLVVASVQSLQGSRLERWGPQEFGTVVVDECHHAVSSSFRRVLEHFEPELLLGVTATPYRADAVSLGEVFDRVVYRFGMLEGIRAGYLADIRAYCVTTGVLLDRVRTVAGDFAAAELALAVDTPARNRLVVQAYLRWARDRRALVFAAGVEHARHLVEAFARAGVSADHVDGSMPRGQRREVLRRFRAGETRVLVNCAVLTEGYDDPGIGAIVLARPTQSLALYTQMVGRGTRAAPGKRDVILIDLVDNTKRHRIVSVGELAGLKRPARSGVSLAEESEREVRERTDRWAAAVSVLAPEATVVGRAEEVEDLFLELSDAPEETDWRAVRAELEEERAHLRPSPPLTEAQATALAGFGWPKRALRDLTKAEASWAIERHMRTVREWARRRAEVWARIWNRSPETVARELYGSPWQMRPATAKQEELMRRLRLRVPPGMLAGEASAVITAAMGRSSVAV